MKLYYAPGACSLAPHIVLREADQSFSLVKVDPYKHLYNNDVDYYTINPKGQVPALQLASGEVITEGPIIAQFIADQAPQSGLIPAANTLPRYRVMGWQNYITSELHKSFGAVFNTAFDENAKAVFKANLRKKYEWLNQQLAGQRFLTGDAFTVADAYLFTVTTWAKVIGLNLQDLSNVQSYQQRISQRPAVQAALKAEGLLA